MPSLSSPVTRTLRVISSRDMATALLATIATAMVVPTTQHGLQVYVNAPRAIPLMAGFGGAAKKPGKAKKSKEKPSGVTAKASWELFRELRSGDNVLTTSVFARLPDEGAKWMNVGGVIVQEPGTRLQAVNGQKRLILEHAARLHPKFALRSRELLCGYSDTTDGIYRGADVITLDKCAVPPDVRHGFQGLPHVESGMYIVQGRPRSAK